VRSRSHKGLSRPNGATYCQYCRKKLNGSNGSTCPGGPIYQWRNRRPSTAAEIFPQNFYKIFGKASLALHGTGFVAGGAIGLPTRPRRILSGLDHPRGSNANASVGACLSAITTDYSRQRVKVSGTMT
jgi:hypothetical protein